MRIGTYFIFIEKNCHSLFYAFMKMKKNGIMQLNGKKKKVRCFMRETVHLNFGWYFSRDFKEDHLTDFNNFSGFEKVDIPHTNLLLPFNYLQEKINELVSTYKKSLLIREEWKNKKLVLVFEGVAHAADVYLNEKFITRNEGGYNRFSVEITDYVSFGNENILTVVVDNHENENIPPFGNQVDYLGYGGIYREVYLEVLEKEHIIAAYLDNPDIDTNLINFRIESSVSEGEFAVEVLDRKKALYQNRFPVTGTVTKFQVDLPEKKLWTLDDPYLYDINIKLIKGLEIIDEYQVRFGFRSVAFTKEGFYLNKKKIKLRGLNRHQSYPYVGYAMPKSAQVKDADILKFDLGLNIVRTSHYPQSKHFLDRCDEIGLLVFEEIPGWQYIGGKEFRENTLRNVEMMIKRDYNHPSIVLWGVRINESPDCHDLYRQTNELAHKLDPTRPTGGVRNFAGSEFFEDVYTFNDFIHSGKNVPLRNPDRVKKGVPYLVTEYNGHMYPTKKFDTERIRVEHALRHYRIIDHASKVDRISGAIGWCMADYNTHDDFGSGDNICYHGVLDMYRLPKYAAYVYSSQQDKTPVLEVLSTMNVGDYPMSLLSEIYVATNADYVKVYRGDYCLGTFYPNQKSKLPHPLIKIDDFIGNQLIEREGFSRRDSERVKKILKLASASGTSLPLKYKIMMLLLMKKYHLSLSDAVSLFYKYNTPIPNFRFEAYKDGKLIKTVLKEAVKQTHYRLKADSNELVIGETYDVTRIVVSKLDQNGNLLPYAFDAFTVKVSGGIDLIGPNILALHAGEIAFWVKTNGQSNEGRATVNFSDQELTMEFKIKRR